MAEIDDVPEVGGDFVEVEEGEDAGVPEGLLELHVALEDSEVTPEQFKEVFGDAAGNAS